MHVEAFSVRDVSEIMGVHYETVRRWIRRGIIKAYHTGPYLIRIPRSEIARMRRHRVSYLNTPNGDYRYPKV